MEFSDVGDRRATGYITEEAAAQSRILPHLRWELEQVMTRVGPADLSAAEIAALLVIMRPAHARVIGGPFRRPELHVVGGHDEQPAPKLA